MKDRKKKCWKCRKLKPEAEFTKDDSKMDGLNNTCLECNREIFSDWATNNPLKAVEVRRKWDAVNRNEYQRNYRKKIV